MKKIKRTPIKEKPQKFSAKLLELIRWECIDEVNAQLDMGVSPSVVHKWIEQHGFKIGCNLVYNYDKLRKQSIIEGVEIEKLLGVIRNPILNTNLDSKKTAKDKLRSELDALDFMIQKGFEDLKNSDESIRPGLMMAAIRLKNDITDGMHGFLTNYGIEHLRNIESAKYELIVKHLLSYIPEDKRNEAITTMAKVEEDYYYNTDYYEEYLRVSGNFSEEQIQLKLEKWKNSILNP